MSTVELSQSRVQFIKFLEPPAPWHGQREREREGETHLLTFTVFDLFSMTSEREVSDSTPSSLLPHLLPPTS